MNAWWIAQADLAGPGGLEAEVLEQSALVLSVYGTILVLGLLVDFLFLQHLRRERMSWSESLSRLYWRPWGLAETRILVLVLAGAFLIMLGARSFLPRLVEASGLSLNSFAVVLQSVLFHWTGLLTVTWMLARRRLPWRSAFGLNPATFLRDAGRGVLILLGVMPVLMVAAMLYNLILQGFGFEATLQDGAFIISDETSPWMRAYFFLLAVVLAPLFEEILFRGILLPALAKRFGATASVVAVSVLFAGIHGHVPSLVPLFVLSAALCLAYIRTGSLATNIAMHAVFNGVTVTLLFVIR